MILKYCLKGHTKICVNTPLKASTVLAFRTALGGVCTPDEINTNACVCLVLDGSV